MRGYTGLEIRNTNIREKIGFAQLIVKKIVASCSRWFGHVWRRLALIRSSAVKIECWIVISYVLRMPEIEGD